MVFVKKKKKVSTTAFALRSDVIKVGTVYTVDVVSLGFNFVVKKKHASNPTATRDGFYEFC